ncbi:hypothetical protein [Acholeplasma equifetale]|nr:hypothetical protein [Acholeplasma equifetale]
MKNIVEDFNDIDILIDIKDVDKVIKIMNKKRYSKSLKLFNSSIFRI